MQIFFYQDLNPMLIHHHIDLMMFKKVLSAEVEVLPLVC
ncbi:hypothetical protein vBEcoMWL3_gp187 [Escherichia phage vB_EcoM_WL-3]|nr:hypothetical protein vBEcoMWL3_gp187 [Escherichia phage vB_EcoM_WL-3]